MEGGDVPDAVKQSRIVVGGRHGLVCLSCCKVKLKARNVWLFFKGNKVSRGCLGTAGHEMTSLSSEVDSRALCNSSKETKNGYETDGKTQEERRKMNYFISVSMLS